ALALFVAQSLLLAAWVPVVYRLCRALELDRGSALAVTLAAAANRAIENGAFFDFHVECAIPLLFVAMINAHKRGQLGALLFLGLLVASTREMAAATAAMALAWLAL